MSGVAEEPPARFERLRRALIREVPRFPNDRASRDHMEAKALGDLIIDYLSWRSRYVGTRPRTVTVEHAATLKPTWAAHRVAIDALIAEVERGADLTPRLSLRPHSQGYSPAAHASSASSEERWSDKDFVLNTMNYHHFHLGTDTQSRGHVTRTDEIMLARVTRDAFDVVAIFGHDVFEPGPTERMRLWDTHDAIVDRGVSPGTVAVGPMITTSGHPLHLILYSQRCGRVMRDLEPKVDGRGFMAELYKDAGWTAPARSRPEWKFDHLDLCIFDRAKPAQFMVAKGWN